MNDVQRPLKKEYFSAMMMDFSKVAALRARAMMDFSKTRAVRA
tara:strand:+ start:205 stop:333 length:129 start_codon:yes stop_codon:yes gene_type:complete